MRGRGGRRWHMQRANTTAALSAGLCAVAAASTRSASCEDSNQLVPNIIKQPCDDRQQHNHRYQTIVRFTIGPYTVHTPHAQAYHTTSTINTAFAQIR